MTPIKFKESNITFAKDQPEYLPLPAHIDKDGVVTACWKLSIRERFRAALSGVLWHQVATFRQPLQPQMISLEKPELGQDPTPKKYA